MDVRVGDGSGAGLATPAVPGAIRYVRALLLVQAVLWGCWTTLFGIWVVVYVAQSMTGHEWPGAYAFGLTAGPALLMGSLAVVKVRQHARLGAGLRRAQVLVALLEVFMVCLGVFLVASGAAADADSDGLPADLEVLAGLAGGVLSATAVVALFTRAARRHFATAALSPSAPGQGSPR